MAAQGARQKSREIYNSVILKVTNVHQVKVNEHGESEWNTRSRSFSGLLNRVNTFLINFKFICAIIDLINFSKVQNFPSYLRNVQCDDI